MAEKFIPVERDKFDIVERIINEISALINKLSTEVSNQQTDQLTKLVNDLKLAISALCNNEYVWLIQSSPSKSTLFEKLFWNNWATQLSCLSSMTTSNCDIVGQQDSLRISLKKLWILIWAITYFVEWKILEKENCSLWQIWDTFNKCVENRNSGNVIAGYDQEVANLQLSVHQATVINLLVNIYENTKTHWKASRVQFNFERVDWFLKISISDDWSWINELIGNDDINTIFNLNFEWRWIWIGLTSAKERLAQFWANIDVKRKWELWWAEFTISLPIVSS